MQFSQKCILTLPVILKFCVARTFLVEFHLHDLFEVLLVVRLKFIFIKLLYTTVERLTEKITIILKWRRYLTFLALRERRKQKKNELWKF